MEGLKRLTRKLKDYLFPIFCVECQHEGEWWCDECRKRSDNQPFEIRAAPDLDKVTALFCYTENESIAKLIRLFKYDFALEIREVWKELLLKYKTTSQETLIIPVPLYLKRKRERGFNQAEVLASILSVQLGLVCNTEGLRRARATPQQTKLSREERLINVKDAFVWVGESLEGKALLLVDDVYTTGATMQECARVLKNAGASKVEGLVIAHG